MKIPPFKDWLIESDGLDPERLAQLGLYSGPMVEWQSLVRPVTWIESDNPVIGKLWFYPDILDRDDARVWTLYPTSFGQAGTRLRELISEYFYSSGRARIDKLDQINQFMEANLATPLIKYFSTSLLVGEIPVRQVDSAGPWSWVEIQSTDESEEELDLVRLAELGLLDSARIITWRFDQEIFDPEIEVKPHNRLGRIDEFPQWPRRDVGRSLSVSISDLGSWAEGALLALDARDWAALGDTVLDWLITRRPFSRLDYQLIYMADTSTWIALPPRS